MGGGSWLSLQTQNDPGLRRNTDAIIRDIVAAQEPGGYLNTFYVEGRKPERMLQHTQEVGHKLYCLGHLLQGAMAYYRATGDSTLLNAGMRMVDEFLLPNFGPGPNQKPIVAGHPEIEMALIELYRTTGKRPYLDLAGYVLTGDPRLTIKPSQIVYMFCGVPFTSRTRLEGHAVRAMYACCGATDYYIETGDPAYWETLNTLWEDLSAHQMYITGGVGARGEGEAFGNAYELPNARAYGESCAAIGQHDVELAPARRLRGGPLHRCHRASSLQRHQLWYVARRQALLLPESTRLRPLHRRRHPQCVVRHHVLPAQHRTNARLASGLPLQHLARWPLRSPLRPFHPRLASRRRYRVKLAQKTNYPWDGEVALTVTPARAARFTLFVQIPGWTATGRAPTVSINGRPGPTATPGQYLAIERLWSSGDTVQLSFDMQPQLVRANFAVAEDTGRIAVQRGPVVYCMEHLNQTPQQSGTASAQQGLSSYAAFVNPSTTVQYQADLLDGIVVLQHPGSLTMPTAPYSLYQSAVAGNAASAKVSLTLIPYYAWANRQPSAMQVWIPTSNG